MVAADTLRCYRRGRIHSLRFSGGLLKFVLTAFLQNGFSLHHQFLRSQPQLFAAMCQFPRSAQPLSYGIG